MSSRPKPIVWIPAALGLAGILFLFLAQRRELNSLHGDLAKLARNSEARQKTEALTKPLPVRPFEPSTPVDAWKRDSAPKAVTMAAPVAGPTPDSTEPSAPPPPVQAPGELAFAEQQQSQRVASQLDQVLEADVVDPSGENTIRQGFVALPEASAANSFRSIECRSRMCRAVVVNSDSKAQAQLGRQLSGHEPFNHGAFYHYDLESSPPTTTIYIAMNGAELGAPAP